jgi:hypothetical protein
MLTIEDIKAKHGPSQFTISIPEWGGDVLAKRLTGPDYIALNRDTGDGERDRLAYMIEVIDRSLINEDGSPLFTEETRNLLVESPLIVSRVGLDILRRNGLLSDKEKNSVGSQH